MSLSAKDFYILTDKTAPKGAVLYEKYTYCALFTSASSYQFGNQAAAAAFTFNRQACNSGSV